MSPRPLDRVLTALGTAGFAVFATIVAHVAGGGLAPNAFVLIATAVPTLIATLALGWVRVAAPRIVLAAVVSQLVFHYLFAATGPIAGTATQATSMPPGAGIMAGHGSHGPVTFTFDGAIGGSTGTVAGFVHQWSWAMAIGHIVAAAVISAVMLSASTLTAALRLAIESLRQRFSAMTLGTIVTTFRTRIAVVVWQGVRQWLFARPEVRGPPWTV